MRFQKDVLFLGMQENTLKDGSKFYKVSFFLAEEQVTVDVNVMGSSADLVALLRNLKFGTPRKATFVLRPFDKVYKLGLVSV